jgi:hypothetical protein
MPYIALNSAEPGIRGLLRYRPETGRPLSELAEVLLRGPNTLTRGERELIAAYVSALNDCRYCSGSHSACAAAQLPGGMVLSRAGPRRCHQRTGVCQAEDLAGDRRGHAARRTQRQR